jgi:hypothetical protein
MLARSGALILALLLLRGEALAQASRPRPAVIVPSITLPALREIPKAEGITRPPVEKVAVEPTVKSVAATYRVTRLQHARSFLQARVGPLPIGGTLTAVNLSGKPPTIEKFSTAIRVQSPQKVDARIEIAIVDFRGEVVMSSAGELRFRGAKGDEVDYTVDWDPVPWRSAGDFQVVVRVAEQPMGLWPLTLVEQNKRVTPAVRN